MTSDHCVFCKIAAGRIPAAFLFESEDIVGFKDANPQAPVHYLFVPKKHISGVEAVSADGTMDRLVAAAKQAARDAKIDQSGYRIVLNSGEDAGQTVGHLHLHLLGGRRMAWPPG